MRRQYLLKQPIRPLLKGLTAAGLLMTSIPSASAETICFAVADNDRDGNQDVLVKMYTDGRTAEIGGGLTNTRYMEAIAFSLDGKTLYAADGDTLGILDVYGPPDAPTTGQFTPIGEGFGTGNGEEGEIEFSDIDGLTFDFATGVLYGTHRREHTSPQQYDVLFQIDPVTGQFKPGVFGGDDYVVVKIAGHPQYYDVDDIASDPITGEMYIVANTGDGVESVLAILDKTTGVATLVGVVATGGGQNIDDIESLSFEPNGTLYGSTGNGGANKGDAVPPTKDQLYQINKETAIAASLGRLMPPVEVGGITQHDFEAVSCIDESAIPPLGGDELECVMYALHDEGKNDTQFIKIDPFAGVGQVGVVSTLGPMYKGLDLEGMAIIPSETKGEPGKLYATSGYHAGKVRKDVVVEVAGKDGHLYEVDRKAGLVIPIGSTGFSEVSGLTYCSDGSLYGWARGVNRKNRYEKMANGKYDRSKPKIGLIKIDPETGASELVFRAEGYKKPDIEGLACSPDGKKLYGSADRELWVYDVETKEFTLKCPEMVKAEVEALEMQPNGLLMLGTDGKKELGMVAYDPDTCQVVATRSFKNLIYDDIESIEWPALECQYRSWLYETSFDAEIELIEYESIPAEVEAALRLALEEAGMDDAAIENEDGELTVYAGDNVLTARPIETSRVKSGLRDKIDNSDETEDETEVTEAQLVVVTEDDGDEHFVLEFTDNDGLPQSWVFYSVANNEDDLLQAIEGIDGVQNVKLEATGNLIVTTDDGQLKAELDMASTPASDNVQPGEALAQKEATTVECPEGYDANDDGIPDCKAIYDDGTEQDIFLNID